MNDPTLHEHPLAAGERLVPPARSPARLVSAAGPVALAVGAVLLFAGWWGASDSTDPGQQLPYLASATVPGLAVALFGCALVLRNEVARARDEARALTERFDLIIEWLASAADGTRPQPNGSEPLPDAERPAGERKR